MSNKKFYTLLIAIIAVTLVGCLVRYNYKENKEDFDVHEAVNPHGLNKHKESDIKASKDRVNVYLFWGDGCGHCKDLSIFLNSLDKKYKDMFNLYSFETWYDDENTELMERFNNVLDEDNTGVPYLIIGKKTFVGYMPDTDVDQEIKDAIEEEFNKKDKIDIYKLVKEDSK